MTSDSRSPKEIEREIEEQRSDLASNIEDLQDKFSIDTVVRQISDQFREHGGDMGRSISNQVKANPIPLALTGIGLAWLMFGNAQQPNRRTYAENEDRYSSVEQDYRRTRIEQGRPYTPPTSYAPDNNRAEKPSWARPDDDDSGGSFGSKVSDRVGTVKQQASDASTSVKQKAADASASAKDSLSAVGSSVSEAAASAKSSLASGAQSVRDGATNIGARITEGTEALSEQARERVIAARRRAIEMQQSASQSISEGRDAAADFYDRQPLVAGALALAVGAALGGALPRTKTEDDMMGARSDDHFDQAERIFEEEKAKAMSVARSVKDEVKDIAAETKSDLDSGAPGDKSAVEAVGDKAKAAAKRVADKAQSSAENENLGKPKT